MERTSGSADAGRASAGKLNGQTPSPFAPRPAAHAYSRKLSPSRQWLQGPADLLGARPDVLSWTTRSGPRSVSRSGPGAPT